jgi:transcriptional regulator with XRE-family HTH domain
MIPSNKNEKIKLRKLLRELRIDEGLRQIDLAKKLGRHQSFVSKYESGEKTLDFIEVKEVSEALGINLTKLVRLFERNS